MSDPPSGLRRSRPLPFASIVAVLILVSSSAASAQPEQRRLELALDYPSFFVSALGPTP